MLQSTWERRLASPLPASFSRTASATWAGNISYNDLLNCHYRPSDRPSSCDDQMRIRRASRNLFSSVFDLGRLPTTLDELMLERLDGRGDLIAIGNPQDRKGAVRRSPWGAQRLYVNDAHWQETVTMLARDADRIVLCVDASDGVRWEIAHVLRGGHASKTLFFLNPSIDIQYAHGC